VGDIRHLGGIELRYDPPEIGGGLDEVVAHNADVHLERMDDGVWCLIVTAGGHTANITIASKSGRAQVPAFLFDDYPEEADRG
jgi:hypothetical protein